MYIDATHRQFDRVRVNPLDQCDFGFLWRFGWDRHHLWLYAGAPGGKPEPDRRLAQRIAFAGLWHVHCAALESSLKPPNSIGGAAFINRIPTRVPKGWLPTCPPDLYRKEHGSHRSYRALPLFRKNGSGCGKPYVKQSGTDRISNNPSRVHSRGWDGRGIAGGPRFAAGKRPRQRPRCAACPGTVRPS